VPEVERDTPGSFYFYIREPGKERAYSLNIPVLMNDIPSLKEMKENPRWWKESPNFWRVDRILETYRQKMNSKASQSFYGLSHIRTWLMESLDKAGFQGQVMLWWIEAYAGKNPLIKILEKGFQYSESDAELLIKGMTVGELNKLSAEDRKRLATDAEREVKQKRESYYLRLDERMSSPTFGADNIEASSEPTA
jgi:hypothetical protein